jgi:hypothetical protein
MFIVYASPKKIKAVKRTLEDKGIDYEETKFPEYLVVDNDPLPYLPLEIRSGVVVKDSQDKYFSILKQAGTLTYLFVPEKIETGDIVRIKKGPLQGVTGIVKEVGKRTYTVEMSAWGKIVKEFFTINDIEKVEQPPEK